MSRLARLLRHEVGDLLQSVYSTVGILVERLPESQAMERRLLADLRDRAEQCKVELDAVVELVSPLPPGGGPTDLKGVLNAAVLQARRRFPALNITADLRGTAFVRAEPAALSGSVGTLFQALCQSAQRWASVGLSIEGERVECRLERDGYAATAEQLAWVAQPFASTQHALFGVALALTRRIALAAGGDAFADNRPEGGVAVRLVFPSAGSSSEVQQSE